MKIEYGKLPESIRPGEAHLGLLVGDGEVLAIPRGARMMLIIDPTRADGIIPLVLSKVTKKFIEFFSVSSNPKNSRRVRFVAQWSGQHLSALKEDSQRAAEQLEETLPDDEGSGE